MKADGKHLRDALSLRESRSLRRNGGV